MAHPHRVVVAVKRHRVRAADLVHRGRVDGVLGLVLERFAAGAIAAGGALGGQEIGHLVDIAQRRRAGLDRAVGKGQRQAGGDHQVAGVGHGAWVQVARVHVGGEKHLVAEAVVQRLQGQQLVVYIAGEQADRANRAAVLAWRWIEVGLAGLERDGQAAQVVELVARLWPLQGRGRRLVLAAGLVRGGGLGLHAVEGGRAVQPTVKVVGFELKLVAVLGAAFVAQPVGQLALKRPGIDRIALDQQHHAALLVRRQAPLQLRHHAGQHLVVGGHDAGVVQGLRQWHAGDARQALVQKRLQRLLVQRWHGAVRGGGGGVENACLGQQLVAPDDQRAHARAAPRVAVEVVGLGRGQVRARRHVGRHGQALVGRAVQVAQRRAQAVRVGRPDQRQRRQVGPDRAAHAQARVPVLGRGRAQQLAQHRGQGVQPGLGQGGFINPQQRDLGVWGDVRRGVRGRAGVWSICGMCCIGGDASGVSRRALGRRVAAQGLAPRQQLVGHAQCAGGLVGRRAHRFGVRRQQHLVGGQVEVQQPKVLGVVRRQTLRLQASQDRVAGAAPAFLGADKGVARQHHRHHQGVGQVVVAVAVQRGDQVLGRAPPLQCQVVAVGAGCGRGCLGACLARRASQLQTAGGLVAARHAISLKAAGGGKWVLPQTGLDLQLGRLQRLCALFLRRAQRRKGLRQKQGARHKRCHHGERTPGNGSDGTALAHGRGLSTSG